MHPMLNTAIKAARLAGSIINRGTRDLDALTISKKRQNDFVTEVDKAAEAAIIEMLAKAYPDHAILAEESGATASDTGSEFQWVIDPLDGTTNFIHGFPQYCVSIGLMHKGKVTQGVIFDPTRNELFTATRGAGAYLNDRRMRVSKRLNLSDALVGTGFPFRNMTKLDRYVAMFKDVTRNCAGIRRAGSAALDLAYVACGRLDAFWEIGLAPWDMAAGSLLIVEAGGLIGDLKGDPDYLESGDVVGGNPRVFVQMLHLLAPHLESGATA
jgi:myo-inositol-1(or 4)-monophosphatase